jgi:hypothetical protein
MFSENADERAAQIKGDANATPSLPSRMKTPLFLSAKLKERDDHVRESWVKAMEARLVREELEKCQKTEGVNHYENCRWLTEKYLKMLKENKVLSLRVKYGFS